MKRITQSFAALVSAIQLVLGAGVILAQVTGEPTPPGTVAPERPVIVSPPADVEPLSMVFTTGEREDRFFLARRQLGLVPKPGVTVDELRRFASTLDFQVVQVMGDNFLIVDIGESLASQELFQRAAAAAAQFEDEFTQRPFRAGVVLYHDEETSTPFVGFEAIIVQFRGEPAPDQLASALGGRSYVTRKLSPALPGAYLFTSTSPGASSLFEFIRELNARADVEFAHIDGVPVSEDRQLTPNDALYPNQWHHANTAQGGGTADADVDTDWAWTITQGAATTLIAVTDSGFDVNHPDYQNNLWANPGEIAGDGLDNDGNGWADDVNGFNFAACNTLGPPFCNGTITAGNHGTAVAGVAAAQGNNLIGVSGACPQCTIALVQRGGRFSGDAQAIAYAQQINANISTNSWGYPNPPAAVTNAINATAGAGVTIFFAMANGNQNDCVLNDISANANVIAVSALSNQDRKVTESAFGNCMEISAPTHRGYGGGTPFTGTLNIATTDRVGNAGYNNTSALAAPCPGETAATNYTFCFGGTSAATPLTAGVAGLMLSANNALTPLQIRRVLQDTADKPQDSTAGYRDVDGFSQPGGGASTHGYGRVNAFEAVRVVAPRALGGRGNVDVFLRDNRLDWGNTEQPSNVLMEPTRGFIPHWRSVDIKVDAPPFAAAPPTTQVLFEAFASEDPEAETVNKVYVRVRNRGQTTATTVRVKLHWAFAGTALPALPADFWTRFPNDSLDPSNRWSTIDPQPPLATLAYSGSSVAGSAGDGAAIVEFDWTAPALDPTAPEFRHHCLLAVVDASNDPVDETRLVPDVVTPTNNNVTHRNVSVQDPMMRDRTFSAGLMVRNPFPDSVRTRLRAVAPEEWEIDLGVFAFGERLLAPGEEIAVEPSFVGRGDGRVVVIQEVFEPARGEFVPLGGFDYVFGDPDAPSARPSGFEAGPGALAPGAGYHAPFAVSLRPGVALPHTSGFSSGPTGTLGLEFAVAPNVVLESVLGYQTLDSTIDLESTTDLDIAQLALNVRYFLSGAGRLTPFLTGGAGAYDLDPGGTSFGMNAGAGLDYALSSRWFLEGTYNYHWIDGSAPEFSTVQLGLRYRF